MSSGELKPLHSPVQGPPPCGSDLEYDPDFMALQQATTGKREQQFGATIIPAEPPDWARIERIAMQLCQRTRDVRVLVPLTLAWTEMRGLPGYVEGLRMVDAMLQSFWDDVHPRVVHDGVEDPLPRMNALTALADAEGIGRSVRDAQLLEDGGASVSLRQVEAFLDTGKSDPFNYPGGIVRLRETARRAHEKAAPPVVALRQALALLRRIRETSEQALGQSWSPDFSRLERSLRTAIQLLPEEAASGSKSTPAALGGSGVDCPKQAAPDSRPSCAVNDPPAPRAMTARDTEVSSRDDVRVLLARACEYMERAEPSHPAPMLIRRAQRLLDLSFIQLIEELLPEGLLKMESLAGGRPDRETDPDEVTRSAGADRR